MTIKGEDAEKLNEKISSENHAVEASVEGSWLIIRTQETLGGEIFEWAIPYSSVHFVAFWPEEEA